MIVLWLAVIALWLIGLVGIVVPVLPGIGFIFAGILLYAGVTGFATISPLTVGFFGLIALIAYGVGYLGAVYGAKRAGGGAITMGCTIGGAIIGMVVIGPLGLLLGAFIGAFIGALMEGKSEQQAWRAAMLTVTGILGAVVVQLLIALFMIISFLIIVLV